MVVLQLGDSMDASSVPRVRPGLVILSLLVISYIKDNIGVS